MMSLVGNVLNLKGPCDIQENSQACGQGSGERCETGLKTPVWESLARGGVRSQWAGYRGREVCRVEVFRKPPSESSVKKQSPT